MTTKKRWGSAKLTARIVRQGGSANGVELTPSDAPLLTAKPVTRRYSPRARKCACGCGVVFKPKSKRGRYFSDACRKRDERKRKARTVKQKPAEPILVVVECQYCHNTFFGEERRGAKYCSDSHKELAYRQRKEATVQALIGDMNIDELQAVEMVERIGMKRTSVYLRGRGYRYDERSRCWAWVLAQEAEPLEQGATREENLRKPKVFR